MHNIVGVYAFVCIIDMCARASACKEVNGHMRMDRFVVFYSTSKISFTTNLMCTS